MSDRHWQSVPVLRAERIHGRVLQLDQAGYCNLYDRIFADNNPIPWTADIHTASAHCSGNLSVSK